MLNKLLPLLSILLYTACTNTKPVEINAHIFERKMIDNNKLMLCYAFNYGNIIMKDSAIIENTIIPRDSVMIVFQKNNPENSNLLLSPGY